LGRKKLNKKRKIYPDSKFNDVVAAKFINILLKKGKKSVAEKVFYSSIGLLEEMSGEDGFFIFKKALENVKPLLEVKSKQVGGARYLVPVEVSSERRLFLAIKWIIKAAHNRGEHSTIEALAKEMHDAAEGKGEAVKIQQNVHRTAKSNEIFAHLR